jgi:hypothetical protein
MPYSPFWFESIGDAFPLLIPFLAVGAMWMSKASENERWQRVAERFYFTALMIVAWGTLRTVLWNDNCWFAHTISLGGMVIGGIFPFASGDSTRSYELERADR